MKEGMRFGGPRCFMGYTLLCSGNHAIPDCRRSYYFVVWVIVILAVRVSVFSAIPQFWLSFCRSGGYMT